MLQSLFLAAIGEARDRGASSVEAFSYRYPEGESAYERFRVHKTVFPQDFLADFGFETIRAAGRVGLSRLELGGLVPVVEGKREKVLRVVKDAFLPEPVPAPPQPLSYPQPGSFFNQVEEFLGGDGRSKLSNLVEERTRFGLRSARSRASESSSASSVSKPGPPEIGRPPISRISGTSMSRSDAEVDACRGRAGGGGSSPAAACPRRARGSSRSRSARSAPTCSARVWLRSHTKPQAGHRVEQRVHARRLDEQPVPRRVVLDAEDQPRLLRDVECLGEVVVQAAAPHPLGPTGCTCTRRKPIASIARQIRAQRARDRAAARRR